MGSRDRRDFLKTIVGRTAKAKVRREPTRMEKELAKEGRRWKPARREEGKKSTRCELVDI